MANLMTKIDELLCMPDESNDKANEMQGLYWKESRQDTTKALTILTKQTSRACASNGQDVIVRLKMKTRSC